MPAPVSTKVRTPGHLFHEWCIGQPSRDRGKMLERRGEARQGGRGLCGSGPPTRSSSPGGLRSGPDVPPPRRPSSGRPHRSPGGGW
eukprot:4504924-Alexandrium_andersonii.AAC.1